MLRISIISTLIFYIAVTIGIHVDVDTCCKAIADISLSAVTEGNCELNESCCAKELKSCCEEKGEEECGLTSLFLQFLAEEQVPAFQSRVHPAEIQALLLEKTELSLQITDTGASILKIEYPPDRSGHQDLYIQHHSLITYG
ncbi:MAG: hypothetical protein HKN79_01445 [Flavobacteriales bacterium]|nr:hypothetical protein [Flavobacteriales bacterium]